MHEQWIRAWDAYRIDWVSGAIFTRLHAGLIRARAKRLLVGPKQYEDHEILPHFWWAEGCDALSQYWVAGDFSTWIEDRVHVRAFGVTFELSGILDILPANSRASAARQFSVIGNEEWLSSTKAIDFIQHNSNLDRGSAKNALFEQAGFGFITSRAVLAKKSNEASDTGAWAWQRREWDVPPEMWIELASLRDAKIDLEAGHVAASSCQAVGNKHISLTGVHFLLEAIESTWPTRAIGAGQMVAKNPGGRLPAPFNDDLMCAVWKRINNGDLTPQSQADIERAILDWVEVNGHSLSESSAREKARKIWAAIVDEDKNPRK